MVSECLLKLFWLELLTCEERKVREEENVMMRQHWGRGMSGR